MRPVRYDRYGSADVLYVADIAEPAPGPGEVKLRVRAASLNPLDGKARAGHLRWVPLFRGPPRATGCDGAGEIVAAGGGAGARGGGCGRRARAEGRGGRVRRICGPARRESCRYSGERRLRGCRSIA